MSKGYIPSLDGIRAISVLLVVLSHAGLGHIIPGGLGVTVFFFLSGLLITTLLIQESGKTGRIDYLFFFLRRFYRLFPPLIITLIVSYILAYTGLIGGGISFEGFFYQVFYLANYSSIYSWEGNIPDGLGILWSLAVEEHFYLVFPLLLGTLMNKASRKTIAAFLGMFCLAVLLWRTNLFVIQEVTVYRIYYGTDTRIDSILFGCIMAFIWNPIYQDQRETPTKRAILLITGSVILLLISLSIRDENFRETLRYSLQGIALMSLFYYSIRLSNYYIFRFLNWSWMRKIGQYSYCIYLIHFVIINFLRQQELTDSILETILLTLVLSIVFAFLVDKYVDSYFRALRMRLHR